MSLGRAEQNDVRLYTASASREHAEIRGDESGDWVLTPVPGKSVLVDGDAITEPIVLEVGMNIVMGGDHLRCVTEGLDRAEMTAQTAVDGMDESGVGWSIPPRWLLIGGVPVIGLVVLALAWWAR